MQVVGPWRLGLLCSRGCGWHGEKCFLRRFPGIRHGKRELAPVGIWLRCTENVSPCAVSHGDWLLLPRPRCCS